MPDKCYRCLEKNATGQVKITREDKQKVYSFCDACHPRGNEPLPGDLNYEHPMDPVAPRPSLPFQIERLKTHFYWISECALTLDAHRQAGYLKLDPSVKPGLIHELSSIIDSAEQGRRHFERLLQLLKESGVL